MKETKMIAIDLIEPNPYQPRLEFDNDALMDLAQSIRENNSTNHSKRSEREVSNYCRGKKISCNVFEWCCGSSSQYYGCG